MSGAGKQGWLAKFSHAFRGLAQGTRGQSSFLVHFPAALIVLTLGWWLGVDLQGTCLLLLCIAMVISAELMNTSIEMLVRRLHPERHDEVGKALDVAAAAVLVAALGASAVGLVVLGVAAWEKWGG